MIELEWEETTLHRVWLAGVQNALVLTRQVFLNKDGSRGELHLINDLRRCAVGASAAHVEETYALRWKVRGRPCGGVLQIDQIKHGLRAFARPPGAKAKQSLIFVDGGLCKVGSGKSSYSIKSFCIEGQIDLKCVKNSVGAMEGLQTSLFYTCSICVTSVIQQESIDIAFIDV